MMIAHRASSVLNRAELLDFIALRIWCLELAQVGQVTKGTIGGLTALCQSLECRELVTEVTKIRLAHDRTRTRLHTIQTLKVLLELLQLRLWHITTCFDVGSS